MTMDIIMNVIGYYGGMIAPIAFIPQMYKIFKTKNTESYSWVSMWMIQSSMIARMVHGIYIGQPAIYTPMMCGIAQQGFIMYYMIRSWIISRREN